ncbi:hypothetical protein TOTORO_00600 [Serratia phage vB_SmaS-Totoro]|nr:hypothetical protein TOTORO_00600 [Serratia phage vB_SmaS-Totoro]
MQKDIFMALNSDETSFIVKDKNSNTVVMADKILSVGNVFRRGLIGAWFLDLRFTSGEAVRFIATREQLVSLKIALINAVENNARKLRKRMG